MCLGVDMCMCEYVCPQSLEEDVGSSGNGVADSCETLDSGASHWTQGLCKSHFSSPCFMVLHFCLSYWTLFTDDSKGTIDPACHIHSQQKLEATVNVMDGWINFEKYYDRLKYWTKTNKIMLSSKIILHGEDRRHLA